MKLNPERIIVNSHSALGDTMEYQPFFLMLRTMFPQAEIHCVCNQNTMLLAKLIPTSLTAALLIASSMAFPMVNQLI